MEAPATGSVEPELNQALSRLRGLMDQASNLPRPQVRSVGQAKAFGLQADDALTIDLAIEELTHAAPASTPTRSKST